MKVRFLHFADLHLGTKFSGLSEAEKRKIRFQEHKELFRKIVNLAHDLQKKEGLDFILIAGDLFEHEFATPEIMGFISYGLANMEVPVFIVPGNHDILVADSPYLIMDWPQNVYIFRENSFQKFDYRENVIIHGIAVSLDNQKKNPLKGYFIQDESKINILLLHGSEIGSQHGYEQWGISLPFEREDIKKVKADYIALGHYHDFHQINDVGYYPGTPEPIDFEETGPRYILKVEIEKGKEPLVEKISLQQRYCYSIIIDCSNFTSAEEIFSSILEHKDKKDAIVKIKIVGNVGLNFKYSSDELNSFIEKRELFFAWRLENKLKINYAYLQMENYPLLQEFLKIIEEEKKRFPQKQDFFELVKILGLDALSQERIRSWNEI